MIDVDIARAWKDESYRSTLSPDQLAALPANPAGMIELTDSELGAADVVGAATWHAYSMGCCDFLTQVTCIGWTACGALCDSAWCTWSC